jgi:hypothetical protein
LVEKLERKKTLGRPTCRVDNSEMDVELIGWEDVD